MDSILKVRKGSRPRIGGRKANAPEGRIPVVREHAVDDWNAPILLKNSNFGLDHNLEDPWQSQWKFP
jgi:hypothetical protein